MKYAVVYNNTENAKLLAEKICTYLKGKGEIVYSGVIDDKALEAERIYLGFSTVQGVCDDNSKDFLQKLTNQELFLFGDTGFGYKFYLDEIFNRVKVLVPSDVKIIGHFICQGKMPAAVKEKYLTMKSDETQIPTINRLLKNFDKALKHPNDKDFKKLKKTLKKVKSEKIEKKREIL